jgi:hypothetical protein
MRISCTQKGKQKKFTLQETDQNKKNYNGKTKSPRGINLFTSFFMSGFQKSKTVMPRVYDFIGCHTWLPLENSFLQKKRK